VLFTGWIEDVPNVLSVMDIFCLPSLWEAFGIVLVEAMAMRLPIVAANVEGIPEVMKDGETGILVPPQEPEALAAAIMKLLKDKTLAKQMGEAGRKRTERLFLTSRIIEEYERLYVGLLEEHLG
jgi:glycosyltransferase involved in cell wall biosynthesis